MKISYMSDLHLEFGMIDKDQFEPADVLILAGDIDVWGTVGEKMFEWMNELPFKHIIYTPGNHEFYTNGNILKDYIEMSNSVSKYSRVKLLWNDKITIDGQIFIGTPLWTNFNNDAKVRQEAYLSINDFNKTIYNKEEYWTPKTMTAEFNIAFKFLMDIIKFGNEIVITHWAPSHLSGDKKFTGDILNSYFTNNLDKFIKTFKPKLWIHGHCHNSSDYMIGETRVLCNPRGYEGYELNEDFNIKAMIEV